MFNLRFCEAAEIGPKELKWPAFMRALVPLL